MENAEVIKIIENLKGRRPYEEKRAAKLGFASLHEYMKDKKTEVVEDKEDKKTDTKLPKKIKEIGGADGPEPTRFGDWEKKGITSDF